MGRGGQDVRPGEWGRGSEGRRVGTGNVGLEWQGTNGLDAATER